jgi:hypothetical protein
METRLKSLNQSLAIAALENLAVGERHGEDGEHAGAGAVVSLRSSTCPPRVRTASDSRAFALQNAGLGPEIPIAL